MAAKAAGAAGAADAGVGRKSQLQLERTAAAAAEKALKAKELLAKARAAKAAAAAKEAAGLEQALKPTPPSKLQQERDAWLKAVGGVALAGGAGVCHACHAAQPATHGRHAAADARHPLCYPLQGNA